MIHVLGVPVDGTLTPAARRRVAEADLLVGGTRLLEAVAGDHPGERWDLTGRLRELPDLLRRQAARKVVVLASGDPLFHGVGAFLARRLGDLVESGALRFLPAPSSVAEAAARFGLPWGDVLVRTAHGRPLPDLVAALDTGRLVAVLTDGRNTPAAVGRALAGAGRTEGTAWIAEALGTPRERCRRLPLAALPDTEADPLNVLFLRGPERPAPVIPYLPDDAFAQRRPKRGMITRREIRALALAMLGTRPGDTAWDIGAGTGSVGIEVARLGAARVFAVEKNAESCEHVRENARRHGAAAVEVVQGRAPEALADLPDPDRVFIGGSGGAMEAIVAACAARLRPGGRIVASLATVENLHAALAALRAAGLEPELTQLQVSRGRPILDRLTRLEALNPVWLAAAGGEGP